MANAAVEKLKKLGLRHGEKAAVGLVAALCVVMVVMAGSKPTIDITPEQIKKAAESAESNLRRPQSKESIIERLNEEKLIPINFAARVDEQENRPRGTYVFTGPPWVQPEPGAGLIRDMPQLIAPTELYATAGRGAIEVLDRDENGEIVYVEVKKEAAKKGTPKRRNTRRGRAMGSYGGGGMGGGMTGSAMARAMMGGGMGGPGAGEPKGELAKIEAKKKAEREARLKAQLFAGTAIDKEEAEAEDMEAKAKEGKEPKTVTRGYRWMAIVGTIDHQKLKDNYVRALKDPNAAPHYLRLDLQRQELQGQEWSDWQDVDRSVNELVDRSFISQDEELAPDDVVLTGLAARLPFLKVGYYKNVHVASLVPKEKREAPKPPDEGSMAGMGGGYGRMMAMAGSGMGGMDSGMAGMGGSGMAGMGGSGRMMGGMAGMEGGMAGMGMMGMGGSGPSGPADTNFARSNKPTLMVRALDYTVKPDTAYRYRVRIVVRNPNLGWETVNAGVDNKTEELYGPWSEPLDPVRVPADVTTYAIRKSPVGRRNDAVQFQVVKWDEKTGLTIVKTFDEAPGQIIGEPLSSSVPKDDGKGTTTRSIDFTSRQVLVDTNGGTRPLAPLGTTATSFEAPAIALVLRNDGQLVLRDEARDVQDPEMKQLKEIYDETLKDAEEGGKKEPTGAGAGAYGSMMGGRMGLGGVQ
jgi:hypothetical protein